MFDVEQKPPEPEPVLVVATINLPDGFTRGAMRWVNPESPYIRAAMKKRFLVVVEDDVPDDT